MIDILSSFSTVCNTVNSSCIIFKSSNDLEWNWDWSLIPKFFSQLLFISLSDVVTSESYITNCNMFSENTWSIFSCVWISQIWFDTSNMSNILESMWWKTSFTSVIIKVTCAVNKLLFWESLVSTFSQNIPMWFKSTNRGKCPAWPTRSLIFDWTYHTSWGPFIWRWNWKLLSW